MNYLSLVKSKIYAADSALSCVELWHKEGKHIVFTNGCFDIVHRGHLDYLAKAAALGDKLVVGLNTDASVRDIKGPERPVIDEYSRAWLLASLCYVDAVMLFNEPTPYELIGRVQPQVLVKGADYKAENIVGYDIVTSGGGKVVTLEFLQGFSTTSIIEKIRNTR